MGRISPMSRISPRGCMICLTHVRVKQSHKNHTILINQYRK